MTISEKKKLERHTFRKLRDEISLNQRENVEKKVKLYVDSFIKNQHIVSHSFLHFLFDLEKSHL